MARSKYSWWHGLIFYAGVQLGSWAFDAAARKMAGSRPASRPNDQNFYRAEKLPVFAPPAAAFPVAWGINNAASIAGAIHVLNLRRGSAGRGDFLRWQAVSWGLFASFNALYFGLRSPVNAAAVTLFYSAATWRSFEAAMRMTDRAAALSQIPTLLWLALANPVGITQAMWNRDEFWKTGPLFQPPRQWLKNAAAE